MTNYEIPIWNDPDVQQIYQVQNGQRFPKFHVFNDEPHQLKLVHGWVLADQEAGSDGPPDAFITACLAGIRAVESLAASVDPGWLKLFIYMNDVNNHLLWDLYHRRTEVAAIAEWTVETLETLGWGADGNSTALGQRHSNAMALAAAAGGGIHTNPATGQLEYGNGNRARQAARDGGFPQTTGARGRGTTGALPEPAPSTAESGGTRVCVWMRCSLKDRPTEDNRCPECGIPTEPRR